jgi:hypothetical protein
MFDVSVRYDRRSLNTFYASVVTVLLLLGLQLLLFVGHILNDWGSISASCWLLDPPSLYPKLAQYDAYHSLASNAEVGNMWSFISTPTIRLHGLVLKHSTFTFYDYTG